MKKYNLMIVLMLVSFLTFFTGCKVFQLNDSAAEKTLIRSAARIAGMVLVEKYPEYGQPATVICKSILSIEDEEGMAAVIPELLAYVDTNAVIKATLTDLMGLIQIDTKAIDKTRIDLIRCAAEAFLEGLKVQILANDIIGVTNG